MWEIYALFPRGAAFQRAEIERIKAANPGFVVIDDFPLDGCDDLRFRNTHPIVDQYIRDSFAPLDGYWRNPTFQVYRRKQTGQQKTGIHTCTRRRGSRSSAHAVPDREGIAAR